MQTLWDSFGLVGLVWLVATAGFVLCLLGYLFVPALRTANVARVCLMLAVAGVYLGGCRSEKVDEIVLADPVEKKPEEIDPAKAAELKARASKVRFAEDSKLDSLDIAGASKSELNPDKPEAAEPKYAYQKRGLQSREGQTIQRPAESEEAAASQPAPKPALKLPEQEYSMVRRLDHLALTLASALLWAGVILLFGDYVMRTRKMFAASLPVGMAARLARTIRPELTHVWVNRASLEGHPLGVLAAIRAVQKDSTCLYVGPAEPWSGRSIPRMVIPSTACRMPSLIFTGKPGTYSQDFVLESLWHGKACVAVVGRENGEKLIRHLLSLIEHKELLAYRGKTLVQVVWDLPEAPEMGLLEALMSASDKAGLSVLIVSEASVPAGLARRFAEVYEQMPEWDLSATAGERALMWIDEKVFARG
jgi:hypothetical protein